MVSLPIDSKPQINWYIFQGFSWPSSSLSFGFRCSRHGFGSTKDWKLRLEVKTPAGRFPRGNHADLRSLPPLAWTWSGKQCSVDSTNYNRVPGAINSALRYLCRHWTEVCGRAVCAWANYFRQRPYCLLSLQFLCLWRLDVRYVLLATILPSCWRLHRDTGWSGSLTINC